MYVIHEKTKTWKAVSLDTVKNFVNSLGLKTDWIKFEPGEELAISNCKTLSVEKALGSEKSLKGIELLYPMN